MLKTIFFDLGNVLVFFSHPKMHRQLAECTGLSADVVRKVFVDEKILEYYESGQIDTAHVYQVFKTKSPKSFDLQDFLNAASDIFTPNTALYPLVEQLKEKGLRLIILSNVSLCHFDHVQAHYPILKLFDDRVLSYKVGAMKPSERIYRYALSQAHCDPKHCFYTDDLFEFIQGARKIGLDGEVYTGVPALKAALATPRSDLTIPLGKQVTASLLWLCHIDPPPQPSLWLWPSSFGTQAALASI